jgi:fructose-bisphosphate aldolase class II
MKEINALVMQAAEERHIVPGFNIFGHEDALAVVRAAERARSPVLLMVNTDARTAMDVTHWGALLGSIAAQARVPVGIHLDHCTDAALIGRAMNAGFTSVMYDGSRLSLPENVANTKDLVRAAHAVDVAVEGEIGAVPYDDMGESPGELTRPDEARRLWLESGLDWLAVSVGNIHRLAYRRVPIDFEVLSAIEAVCAAPLVIHGSSGIAIGDLERLRATRVAKMNFGTVLRLVIGQALRQEIVDRPEEFDRQRLLARSVSLAEEKAHEIIMSLHDDRGRSSP